MAIDWFLVTKSRRRRNLRNNISYSLDDIDHIPS